MTLIKQGRYQFGEFQLDLRLRVLTRQNERVPLGAKALDVLACLVPSAGEIVTKAELFKAAWPDSYVEEGALSQQIFTLRKALADQAHYVVTVPGQGYRFTGEARYLPPVSALAPATGWDVVVHETRETRHIMMEESVLPVLAPIVSRSGLFWSAIAAGALAVVGILLVGWAWAHRAPLPDHLSIVVADFVNTTGDAGFDRVLKRALEIDLEQSPYLDVLSESESASTLQAMGVKAVDAPLTEGVAREMCMRTNGQVVLLGSIVSVAEHYLVSLQATDCNTGKRLGAAKMEAASKAKVLSAVDAVADRVRAKLGESAKSVASYEVAIEQATTPSLEALRAYSIGNSLAAQGRPATESLPFFRHAVEIDPQFAVGYDALGTAYFQLDENELSLANFQRAMDLSDRVSEREKLMLRAHYYGQGQHNVHLGLETYKLWTATYPHDLRPAIALVGLYTDIGQPEQGVAFGGHALQLLPASVVLYQAVIRACTHAGKFAEAKSLGSRAMQLGKDNSHIHASLWQVAYAEHNAADLQRESQWAQTHADGWYSWFFLDLEANAAAAEGRYRDAQGYYAQSVVVAKHEGLDDLSDQLLLDEAATETLLSERQDLRATLELVANPGAHDVAIATGRAELGDVAYAEKILASASRKPNPGFSDASIALPSLRATIALAQGRPLEAISALEGSVPYDLADHSMSLLRGEACLRAAQPQRAIAAYQTILNNPGIDPANPQLALARLGLARAFAKAGYQAAARRGYEDFLASWKNADADSPLLRTAREELAGLR